MSRLVIDLVGPKVVTSGLRITVDGYEMSLIAWIGSVEDRLAALGMPIDQTVWKLDQEPERL